MEVLHTFLFFGLLFYALAPCTAQDTIAAHQAIRDGDTLVSADERYELGFFSPGSSRNRYLGIWYKNMSPHTVVWVANRETPIRDSSGVFRVDTSGSLLVLVGSNNTVVWSSNSSLVSLTIVQPVAQLLNSGNLVVRDGGQESVIWQSFDYPGDTVLPGMKLGKDLVSGRDWRSTSWKSLDDPSPGEYVFFMDTNGFPQMFEVQGSVPMLRMGPWNGPTFSGMPKLGPSSTFKHEFVLNDKEAYYWYTPVNSSIILRIYLNPDGSLVRQNWINRTHSWLLHSKASIDMCTSYGLCGPYGMCDPNNSPACSCMEGFEPRSPKEWNEFEWSSGCHRRNPLSCQNRDGFRVLKNVKMPDTRHSWYNRSMALSECMMDCKRNCSCTAYANIEFTRGGSGCLLWFGDLMDVRTVEESQDLYVRVATSESTIQESGSKKTKHIIFEVVSIPSALVLVGLILAIMCAWNKKKRYNIKASDKFVQAIHKEYNMESQDDNTELSTFSLSKIAKSTNGFANDNKLGEGGFGPVYKGVLEDGREIAVKRLSKASRQGLDEFKNEVRCIAKLQHRNLVKLLGYCIQGDESMLIYEYMPNKSLDTFIFDKTCSSILGWSHRFHIIHGIARGLLYLHQDSRLKIVHRDLKASNILLDFDMNPKISDFGLARIFSEHENEANTNKIAGTMGYISPEYAVNGTFSEKSDIYSFGVLVLEIVSGMKNQGFSHENNIYNLPAHAWRLYEEGMALELVDEPLRNTCVDSEVLRSIHIGLLCVQHHAKDRPTMSSVVSMFDKEGALPWPKRPAYFAERSSPKPNSISINEVMMTTLEAR